MRLTKMLSWKRALVLVGAGLLLLAAYWSWPRVGLALIPLEEGDERWAEDLTFAAGERAIGPTVECIRKDYSGLNKEQGGWVQVLQRFGEPAHQALLRAATIEQTVRSRDRLISALVNGFADYEMVPIWVDDLINARIPLYVGLEMSPELRRIYLDPEMPEVTVLGDHRRELNGEFVLWWKNLSDAQKRGQMPTTGPTTTTRPD